MVQHGFGVHNGKNINQFGKPVPLKLWPKDSTVKAGARWKRPSEWPKAKAASHLAEWNSVYEGPRAGPEMTMWLGIVSGQGEPGG